MTAKNAKTEIAGPTPPSNAPGRRAAPAPRTNPLNSRRLSRKKRDWFDADAVSAAPQRAGKLTRVGAELDI
jgi:hypothetical protein